MIFNSCEFVVIYPDIYIYICPITRKYSSKTAPCSLPRAHRPWEPASEQIVHGASSFAGI